MEPERAVYTDNKFIQDFLKSSDLAENYAFQVDRCISIKMAHMLLVHILDASILPDKQLGCSYACSGIVLILRAVVSDIEIIGFADTTVRCRLLSSYPNRSELFCLSLRSQTWVKPPYTRSMMCMQVPVRLGWILEETAAVLLVVRGLDCLGCICVYKIMSPAKYSVQDF